MKLIITGGAGFIGSHTVVELIEQGHEAVIIDDFSNSEPLIVDRIAKITGIKPKLYQIDCANKAEIKKVFTVENPDGVIHFAASKAVGESVEKPLLYYKNNIGSLLTILEVMKEEKVKNIVFSSSCTVYGSPEIIPVNENTPIKEAESPYGNTKQIGERILIDFQKANPEFNVSILRYFNPIGAHSTGLIGELPIGTPNNLIPFITQTAAGIRKELTVFGDTYNTKDGSCVRDYIHVVDLALSHIKAIEKLTKQNGSVDIYNVGTGVGSSVLEVINAFERSSKQKLNYKIGEPRTGDISAIYADNSKIVNELKWSPKYDLEDALTHAWKWQKSLQK